MRIQKTKLVKLLAPFPPTTTAIIDNGYIFIRKTFLFGEQDEKAIKIVNIAEVEVNQMGLLKTLFNYGSITIRGEGDTIERIDWIKNPRFYEKILKGKA